jgi:rod shape-determining protein MreB and related proteins
MFEKKIGIDLGTANVLVYVKGRGIVIQEPSIVAISISDNKIVAVGEEARTMLGRVPEAIEVLHPLRDGVIADYVVTEALLRYFIERIAGRFRLTRPIVMVSVPVGVTSVEERAVRDAARQASGREAYVIPEPLAAAIGAGMPIDTPTGSMVVDIGGGTSESAVVSVYGIVVSSSVRVGGLKFDDAIASYLRRKHNLVIGEQTAEEIKIAIGSALPMDEPMAIEVQGRDQVAGLPRTITVTSDEVTEALAEPLAAVVGVVKNVLEQTPPELASDIIDRGMVLTGGGALLRNVDRLLAQQTNVPCYIADNPMACVALGAGRAIDIYDAIRRSMATY